MTSVRMQLILTENWTMTSGRDLNTLVRWAREAEDAGFDSVMASEHVVLGPDAGARGRMANPREYALPGNQDPATPWPANLLLLSAISSVTTSLRLAAVAVLAPSAIRSRWPRTWPHSTCSARDGCSCSRR
ncbi:LLM class oxidoreductase [Thermocatellispora tengchongensis]|uniref:hypothetical protein n=1 Tax=Thermocatellispora tengchongensis TaxID=1073253 RepID=UPI0036259BA5